MIKTKYIKSLFLLYSLWINSVYSEGSLDGPYYFVSLSDETKCFGSGEAMQNSNFLNDCQENNNNQQFYIDHDKSKILSKDQTMCLAMHQLKWSFEKCLDGNQSQKISFVFVGSTITLYYSNDNNGCYYYENDGKIQCLMPPEEVELTFDLKKSLQPEFKMI
jgi:hypothetical protein